MCATVVINGIPQYITFNNVAESLRKLFDVRLGSFQVRDLRDLKHKTYLWQFALDFNSVYEAMSARNILHGYNYVLPNGITYVLSAEMTEHPQLMRPKKSLVPTAGSIINNCDEEWSVLGLVPKGIDNELYTTCARMDAQIEFLNKQKLLVQAERKLLTERRRLYKEYNRKDNSDTDFERRRSRRSPKRRRYRSRYRYRSRSRNSKDDMRTTSTSILPCFPNDGLILPDKSSNLERSIDSSTADPTSYDIILHELHKYCGKKETSFETTDNYNNINAVDNELDPSKHKSKDTNIKFETNETIRKIIKEMDTTLDQVCYEKHINILEKGLNFTVLRKLKDIVRRRIDSFKVMNNISSSAIMSYYRRFFSRNDDKQLVEELLNEYLVEKPHIQNKKEINNSAGSSINYVDSEENSMWRAVDEVLQDINIEMLSSDYDEGKNISVENETMTLNNMELPRLKETIDTRQEPIKDSKTNTNVEILVVVNNNINVTIEKQNNADKKPQTDSGNYIVDSNISLNRKPSFYLTINKLLRQMKSLIREFEQLTGVNSFKAIVAKQIRNKIMVLLRGKGYMKSASITKLFREHNPRTNDRDFIKGIAEDAKIEKYSYNGTENKMATSLSIAF